MTKLKFKARIKHLELTVDIQRINFDGQTVECYLTSPEEGDLSEFSFDEIKLYQYAGIDMDRANIYTRVSP